MAPYANELWRFCFISFAYLQLSWEFSIPVLAGLIPRERFHRRAEGKMLSPEALPRNQQLLPNMYNEERKEQS
jgi:hypothetical protein